MKNTHTIFYLVALLLSYRCVYAASGDIIWDTEVTTTIVDSSNYGSPPTDAFVQDGVGVTIDYAFPDDPDPGQYDGQYFTTSTATLGNETGFFQLTMDTVSGASGGNTECIRTIFQFSPAITGLQFPLLDIDLSSWRDMVLVRGTYQGTLVSGTATIVDSSPTVQEGTPAGVTEYTCTDIQNEFGSGLCLTGIVANAGATETRGNVDINYADLIDRLEISYCESDNATNNGQRAGIGDMSWTGNAADNSVSREYGDAPASYGDAGHDLNSSPLLETVTVSSVDENWQTVSLNNAYTDPVVVCSNGLAAASSAPAVVRVRNATATGFDVRLQNPGDGTAVTPSTVRCVVAESGYHSLPDGRVFEAHTLTSTVTDHDASWTGQTATVIGSYTSPVVLGQVMTFNDANWSVFWSSQCGSRTNPPTAASICIGKHVGEDSTTTRADETLGYIIIEAGNGSFGNVQYEAILGTDTVEGVDNGPPFSYALGSTNYDFAVVTQSAMDGFNGGWANLWGANPISSGQLDLAVDEDQMSDTERSHITEQVAYWAFYRTPSPYFGILRGDPEAASQYDAAADGDNTAGVDDEDGVEFRSPSGTGQSIFADVTVTNPTASSVTVCGWLDIPSGGTVDGVFDSSDGQCQSAATGTNVVTFQWSGLPRDQAYTTYARFRVSSTALSTSDATGIFTDGEVEDYQVLFDFRPTVVTVGRVELKSMRVSNVFNSLDAEQMSLEQLRALLGAWAPEAGWEAEQMSRQQLLDELRSYLDPDGDGQVAVFHWETLEERGTIGFFAERRTQDGDWTRINKTLLPGLITAPLGGEYLLADPQAEMGVRYEYRLIEQEARGSQKTYGPYKLEMRP